MYDKGNAPKGFVLDPDAGSLVNTFKPNDKVCKIPGDLFSFMNSILRFIGQCLTCDCEDNYDIS